MRDEGFLLHFLFQGSQGSPSDCREYFHHDLRLLPDVSFARRRAGPHCVRGPQRHGKINGRARRGLADTESLRHFAGCAAPICCVIICVKASIVFLLVVCS